MILYPDPQDYTDAGGSTVADVSGTWWLPGDAVIRSSVRYWLTGDPLTPDYPAVGLYTLSGPVLAASLGWRGWGRGVGWGGVVVLGGVGCVAV